jgi:hypothetical protein
MKPSRRADLAISLGLALPLCLLYILLGEVLERTAHLYDYFGADPWTASSGALHPEPRHLLVPLFLEPPAALLTWLGLSRGDAQVGLNAAFGGLGVVLAYYLFRHLLQGRVEAILLAALFGLTMSQLLFAALPETYAVASAGLVAVFLLFARSVAARRVPEGAWFGVALFTVGITTSNLAPVAVLYVLALRASRVPSILGRLLRTAMLFVLVVGGLVVVQGAVLGTGNPISRATLREEWEATVQSVVTPEPGDPPHAMARTPRELGRNLLLFGFVGGMPGRTVSPDPSDTKIKIEYFRHPTRFTTIGVAAVGLWLLLWASGFVRNAVAAWRRENSPEPLYLLGVVVVVAGHGLLITVYNPGEMFAYTPLILFPLLLLGTHRGILERAGGRTLLAAVVALAASNNVMVLLQMVR